MRRREFITVLGGGVAGAWPLAARAQQSPVPVIGVVNAGLLEPSASRTAAFRKGLSETGYVEGQNVAVEYHWFGGEYDRLTSACLPLETAVIRRFQERILTTDSDAERPTAMLMASKPPISLNALSSKPSNPLGSGAFFQNC
jgi:hypothetical protein